MNIIITTPIMPPQIGGPATYVSQLAKQLSEKHDITILTFTQHPLPIRGVRTIVIPLFPHRFGTLLRQATLAVRLISSTKSADVVYAQGPIVTGLTSAVVGKFLRKRVIVKFVGDIAWEESERRDLTRGNLEQFLKGYNQPFAIRLLRLVQKLTLSMASGVLVPSHYLKRVLVTGYAIRKEKIHVIPNAVDLPKHVKKRLVSERIIFSSGRLVPHKRFEVVLDAFVKLKETRGGEKLKLVIVGDGPQRAMLEEKIKKLELSGKAQMTGSLNRTTYLHTLSQASLFVLASSYEGLPHAIIEAMLLGIPVVATDIPGNREVITDHETGLLVNGDAASLARSVHRMLTDGDLQKRLTTNAKRQAQTRFDWKTHLERLVHLFGQESSPA